MIRDLLKALALSHALPIAGLFFALCAMGYGAYSVHERRVHSVWFNKGATFVRDSAGEAAAIRQREDERVHARVADSLVRLGHLTDSLKAVKGPRVARIEPLAANDSGLVPTVPLSELVKVYVASDSVPTAHYADRYLANLLVYDDSLIYREYQPRLEKAYAANKSLYNGWLQERLARQSADSARDYWQARALRPPPQPKLTKSHRLVYVGIGVVVGILAAKRLH